MSVTLPWSCSLLVEELRLDPGPEYFHMFYFTYLGKEPILILFSMICTCALNIHASNNYIRKGLKYISFKKTIYYEIDNISSG